MRNLPGLGALVVMVAVVGAGASASEEWKQISDGDVVIRVRPRPEVPGAREVWAEGDIEARPLDVQAALRDHDNFRRWMPYVTESRVLERTPDGRVTYTRLNLPVISNRDYVLRVVDERLLNEDGTGEFLQRWTSDSKALPEQDGVVRLHHNDGSWLFTPGSEGKSHFVYRFTVEPGGSIPGFLAGLGQKDAVMDTVRAVEKRAQALAAEKKAGTR